MVSYSGKNRKASVLIFIFILIFLFIPLIANGDIKNAPYAGKKLSEQELQKVLKNHAKWLKKYKKHWEKNALRDPLRANLSWANLNGANLNGANLSWANLSNAELFGTELNGAKLESADMSHAYLIGTHLSRTLIVSTNLTDAKLNGADLSGALMIANLAGADLTMSDLNDTEFLTADLNHAVFEPAPGKQPDIRTMASARNLSLMVFKESPQGLTELRNGFRDAGFRDQERQITYAIEHSRRMNSRDKGWTGRIESIFSLIFFELTVQYGMSPGRALIILVFFIPFFSVPYILVLCSNSEDGIWKEWAESRMRKDLGNHGPERLKVRLPKAFLYGIYFSILSAFHIGWRDLNVGNWIARIQPREYTLKATGWVRTVSGVQSLISVYLLAMWALSYFGRPFG